MKSLTKKINLSIFSLSWVLSFTLFLIQPLLGQETLVASVDLNNLSSMRTEIRMNAGTLQLSTHSKPKADLDFIYTREAWMPEVKLDQGLLLIRQPEEKSFSMRDKDRNEWDVKLPRSMPGDLKIQMGAGEGIIDLKDAKLNRLEMAAGAGEFTVDLANAAINDLEISAGVGELTLDLSGRRSSNLKGTINGGIGDLTLLLPADSGVRIKVNGLGSVDHPGLKKRDGYYVNEAYGSSSYSIEITVNGGLGSVEMVLR